MLSICQRPISNVQRPNEEIPGAVALGFGRWELGVDSEHFYSHCHAISATEAQCRDASFEVPLLERI